jgi:hypothetical protein
MMAQTIRASLFATATVTTRAGLRASNAFNVNHGNDRFTKFNRARGNSRGMLGWLVNSRLMRPLRDSVKHMRLLETNEENTMTMPIAILVVCIGTVAVIAPR